MADPNDTDRPWDKGGRERRDRDERDDRPRRDRDDDDYDDGPRRRDRDDDYDDRPRRRRRREPTGSGGVPVLAIVLGVLVLGGCVVGGLVLLLFPAVERVRAAAGRTKDSNSMKQIGIGVHAFHDANQTMPPAQDPVSWRVHILPYIEQDHIYRQMDPKQPWDAPVNRPFANQLIPQYHSTADPAEMVETRFRVFVGPHTLYEPGARPMPMQRVTDGTSNTIFLVEAAETVPWPEPRELPYDRTGPLPALGSPGRDVFLVGMLDGSVRFVSKQVSPDVLRAGIEPNDGRFFTEP
jgi:hypothetical protein